MKQLTRHQGYQLMAQTLAKNQKTRKSGVAERHAIRGSALVSN